MTLDQALEIVGRALARVQVPLGESQVVLQAWQAVEKAAGSHLVPEEDED